MRRQFLASVLTVIAMTGVASADDFPSSMRRRDCTTNAAGERIYPTNLYVTALANRFGVGYMEASDAARLGTLAAQDANKNCGSNAACLGRQRMFRHVRDLLREPPLASSGNRFSVRITPPTPDVESILNNNAPGFQILCQGQDDPPPAPLSYLARTIVGESVDDALREFSSRKFANVAFTDDREADTESYTVNAAFVFPRIGSDPERNRDGWPVQPFIALQRSFSETANVTKRNVDDLTFGLTATLLEEIVASNSEAPDDVHRITAAVEWETDTEFESSVASVRLNYEPQLGWIPCLGHNVSERIPLRCELRGVADWIDVSDPGEKSALATYPDFTRFGFDVNLNYDLTPEEFPGQIVFNLDYQRREDLDGEDGDADLFRAGLTLQPGKASHFSFGIEFATGEDLSSLQEQEQLIIKFGYRR